ncbi:MAG: hypothetical protein SWZ49_27040 [Cyanobacteriota bacterium]|nr:hypothetical protein [Cyanobacteriota bacterium]
MKKTKFILSILAALPMLTLIFMSNAANAQTVIEESTNSQFSTVSSLDCHLNRCHGGL